MRNILKIAVMVVCVLFLAVGCSKSEDKKEEKIELTGNMALIQGTWNIYSVNNQVVTDATVKKTSMTFSKRNVTMTDYSTGSLKNLSGTFAIEGGYLLITVEGDTTKNELISLTSQELKIKTSDATLVFRK
ncbi:lipocalin family protein [Capnocytophaga haemolytica]|jgi:lipoprotein|nr:lipocalin family protein [Capnocytophaga haemolytica]